MKFLSSFSVVMVLAAGAISAEAQPACPVGVSMGSSGGGSGSEMTYRYSAPVPRFATPITGAPYSGQRKMESTQTTSNGAHLSSPMAMNPPMTYRDSLGRTRTDAQVRPVGPGAGVIAMQLAAIDDPVAGSRYILDPVNQVAHRIPFCTPAPQAGRGAPGGSGAGMGMVGAGAAPIQFAAGVTQSEDLGTQMFSGVVATGKRTTTTFPPGTYRNNDIPVVTSNENWFSAQYGNMMSKSVGPDNTSTTTMVNFSLAEPDPMLFQVPAGWKIVDETGPFAITIHWGN